jgi:RNA polymerase sigma-70 factor (ECF subfamily)
MAYRYAYTLLGDAQWAEDAVQEGLLTAYQRLAQLREPRAFSLWLRRILQTHCRRILRQKRRALQSLEQSPEICDRRRSPQETLEDAELQRVVQATIAALPYNQQAPVTLYYLDDYSQAEIAHALNLSVDAVKKRLERARGQLAERMHEMAADYLATSSQGNGPAAGLFMTLMDAAANEGQTILLETLLVEGMDVNEPDAHGWTLLHWAANEGNLEAVELLLHYSADTTCRDHTGRTPLQFAVEGRHSTIAKALRQAAAHS